MPGPLCPLEQGYTPIGQLDFADGIVRLQIIIMITNEDQVDDHDDYVWNIMTMSSLVIHCNHLMIIVVVNKFFIDIIIYRYISALTGQ